MVRVYILALFVILSTYCQSQNLFGDFTERDFISRKSTVLTCTTVVIDTITKKQIKSVSTITYNPQTKLLAFKNSGEKYVHYSLTDTLNELYTVDKNGKRDTVIYKPIKTEYLKNGIIKCKGDYRFYDSQNNLIRTIIDTAAGRYHLFFYENNFYYSGKTLIKSVFRMYDNTLYPRGFAYSVNEPIETKEITFLENKEITLYERVEKPLKKVFNSIAYTDRKDKLIVSKTYCRNKLIKIETIQFK